MSCFAAMGIYRHGNQDAYDESYGAGSVRRDHASARTSAETGCQDARSCSNVARSKSLTRPVRKLMIQAGIWQTRAQRKPKVQQPRLRRPCFGELIQPVHMLHQCAICTMMPHAFSGTVQSLSHRDVLQRPRASALSHRHDK
jgi:hypothetical protein